MNEAVTTHVDASMLVLAFDTEKHQVASTQLVTPDHVTGCQHL